MLASPGSPNERKPGSATIGGPAAHSGAKPRQAYLWLCAGPTLVMLGATINMMWTDPDFWVWSGAIRELATHPFLPSHPLVAIDAADPYLGPYTLVLGLVAGVTTVEPVTVLAVAGILNLGLVFTGVWRLASAMSSAQWCPHLTPVFTLVAWGWQPWRWSGYPNLNSLGFGLPYGSTFAYGVGLTALAWLWMCSSKTVHGILSSQHSGTRSACCPIR